MTLERYNQKRDFSKTPEPAGKVVRQDGPLRFVIQKHAASRLHYDFRLELGGVLLSWAVPKGPSLNPADKRLAVHVEDHPVEYGGFEGIIPEGEYGGGSVILWDRGRWYPEGDAEADYKRGNLKFRLDGEKLQGSFALVRMHGPRSDDGKNWLLLKHEDDAADADGELLTRDRPESVETGRTVEQVAADPDRMWRSNRGGKKGGEQELSAAERKAHARQPKPKPAAASATPEDSEELARKRLGLAPRAAARTTAKKPGAKKTASKATQEAGAKKTAAKKTAGKATAKKTAAKTTTGTTTAKKTASKTTAKAGKKTASKGAGAKQSGSKAAGKTASKAAGKTTGKSAGKAASKSAGKAASKAAGKAASKAAGTTSKAAGRTTSKAAGKAASKAAGTTSKAAGKTTSKAAGKTASKATNKTAGKATSKKATKKTTAKRTGRASKSRASDEPGPTVQASHTGDAHLLRKIAPELATLVESVPPGAEWMHEVKFDGYRLVARIDGAQTQLLTRGGEDWSARFPWLVEALRARVGVDAAILDGELVHLGSDGVTRFGELQRALSEERHDALVYFVFDVMHLAGHDLRGLPLDQRKQALAELLPPERKPGRVRVSEFILGQGEPLFTRACKIGLEGVISKRRASTYLAGRHRDWLKIKCGKRQEVVVGGFTPARSGSRDIGALLLGLYDDAGNFVYCGKVGSGFDFQGATRLRARLDKLVAPRSPFSKMPPGFSRNTFVRPEVVVEISFTDWTSDGRMRHPVFEGVREDKPARDIRREKVVPVEQATDEANTATKTATKAASKTATPRFAKKSPVARKSATRSRGGDAEIAGVHVSHPDRILYPADEISKRDIAEYYAAVAEWMMPWVHRRPISVVRCPDNIDKQLFFQKHIHHELPPGVRTADLDGEGGDAPFIYVEEPAGLVGLTQVGTLEIHVWGSTVARPEDPDRIIFDLDPDTAVTWARIKETAVAVRTRLEDLGLQSFLKTTGGKGLHVVVPLTPGRQDWDQVKAFAHGIALEFARAAPDMFTATATKAKRTGRIYIDYLRNYRGSTSVAPYSTRARPGAPVSVPLRWDELTALEIPNGYTIANLAARLSALKADPWKELPKTRQFLRAEVLKTVVTRGR